MILYPFLYQKSAHLCNLQTCVICVICVICGHLFSPGVSYGDASCPVFA